MKYLLALILLLSSSVAMTDSGAYRVEVIIFRDLRSIAEPEEISELRSFSQFPALQEDVVVPEPGNEGSASENLESTEGERASELRDGKITAELFDAALVEMDFTDNLLNVDLPDDLHIIMQKSDHMDNIWRRLNSSNNYRPLNYVSWQQNRTDYYPAMRIHDEQLIATRLHAPTATMNQGLDTNEPITDRQDSYYRLDGTVQLRRSRFLHLFLDLEYRQTTPNAPDQPVDDILEASVVSGPNTTHRVFKLKQNRQIRQGATQYFDTPYFGALILVSTVSTQKNGE